MFTIIAGPCVLQDNDHHKRICEFLKRETAKYGFSFLFKASFDKANRSSIHSYRGPGLHEGLKILDDLKRRFEVPVISDIHETAQIGPAADVLDMLQIPAFLCRQTDLITGCAQSGRATNIKKGQFLSPWDMNQVIEKYTESGGTTLWITERGTTFGYNNLVVDYRSIGVIKKMGVPLIFDVTHSCQLPGGGKITGGNRDFAKPLALAAVAAGADGLFMEVFPEPEQSLSDKTTVLPFPVFSEILAGTSRILSVINDEI
jgi:2-dehydro-3-deoxyphosphooctonate aldolase (KDO 8-P synthase)